MPLGGLFCLVVQGFCLGLSLIYPAFLPTCLEILFFGFVFPFGLADWIVSASHPDRCNEPPLHSNPFPMAAALLLLRRTTMHYGVLAPDSRYSLDQLGYGIFFYQQTAYRLEHITPIPNNVKEHSNERQYDWRYRTYLCSENVGIHVLKKSLKLFDSGTESTDPNDPTQK